MELDATTFALEIINFLVLLWLLHRFLYKPVQAALQARAAKEAAQAQAMADERAALVASARELDAQRAALATQHVAAEAALSAEIAKLRSERMQALARELDDERDKARARIEQERLRAQTQSDSVLRQRTAAFVADYLKRLATPALEAAIIDLFLSDLQTQSEQARLALCEGASPDQGDDHKIDVATAHAPSADQRARVEAQLHDLMGRPVRIGWREDASLLAGICAHLPGHQLEASLRRGVDAFAAEGL